MSRRSNEAPAHGWGWLWGVLGIVVAVAVLDSDLLWSLVGLFGLVGVLISMLPDRREAAGLRVTSREATGAARADRPAAVGIENLRPAHSQVQCAYCHDGVHAGPAHELPNACEGCGVVLHVECAREIPGCPTLGCKHAARRRRRGA
jgi:hypothetical protein